MTVVIVSTVFFSLFLVVGRLRDQHELHSGRHAADIT